MTVEIKINHLTKQYVNDEVITNVLNGIDLQVEPGEFVAIMGPSGSGKSTLMHILGLLDRATGGTYHFKEHDVSLLSDDVLAQLRNQEIGFIFQTFNLLPKATVLENVMLPLIYAVKTKRRQSALVAIEAVGMSHRLNHRSNQLSGGEQQRVAIARALVNKPGIIFADEPTGNLDTKSGAQIMSIIQDLNEAGHTVLLVTHETYTAEHAKRIIRMRDGRITHDELIGKRRFAKDD